MGARDRARQRWEGAPKGCQHRANGLICNRDANHRGKHYDARPAHRGYWGAEFRDLDGQPEQRLQFCDLDWQSPKPESPAFYMHYDVGKDSLFLVGLLGSVYCTKENSKTFVESLRRWADSVEKYMETYDD